MDFTVWLAIAGALQTSLSFVFFRSAEAGQPPRLSDAGRALAFSGISLMGTSLVAQLLRYL